MKPSAICSGCGKPLPYDAPQGCCPECLFDLLEEAPAHSETEDDLHTVAETNSNTLVFGDYEMLNEIARGGMGVVYKARQISLNRIVAVKVLLGGQFAAKELIRRFRAEAGSAAALRHPHIIAIYDVGVHQGQHYLAMEHVAGQNLAQLIKHEPLRPAQAARYLTVIAEAIHFGHEHGILHRDLKPSNILIDSATDQPRVTDFGLARRLEGESSLTLSGQVLGSPNFMPPEQAGASHGKIGRQSDVYGLGAILYYMLTARPPFQGETIEATINHVLHTEPVSPRLLNPIVPADLETICLKCLEKQATRRYETAQALADELARFLRDEPIHARPASKIERAWRWARRNPVVAGLSLAISALLLAFAVGTPIALVRISHEKRHAEEEAAARRLQLYAAQVNLAGRALEDDDLLRARTYLDLQRPGKGEANDPRGFEWRYLYGRCHSDELGTLGRHDSDVRAVRFSPDGTLLASVEETGFVKLWDWRAGKLLSVLPGPSVPSSNQDFFFSSALAFSPDSRKLAVGAAESIILWDVPSRRILATLRGHERPVNYLSFLPDEHTLGSASADGTIRFWETVSETPSELARLTTGTETVLAFVCSHDGRALIASVKSSTLKRWDITDLQAPVELPLPKAHSGWALPLTISPQSDLVIVPNGNSELILWNLTCDPKPLPFSRLSFPSNSSGVPGAIVVTPDGHSVVWGGADHNLTVWDLSGKKEPVKLKGHEGEITSVDVSPDGRTLASCGVDKTVRLWDLASCLEEKPRHPAGEFAVALAISPDGKFVASGSQDGLLKLWDTQTGEVRNSVLEPATNTNHRVAFSADSKLVASVIRSVIHLRQVPSLIEQTSFPGSHPHFTPNGRELVYYVNLGERGELRWRNLETRAERAVGVDWRNLSSLAISGDGRQVAASRDRQLRLWKTDALTRPVQLGPFAEHVRDLSFSPDGERLAIATGDGTVGICTLTDPKFPVVQWTAHKGYSLAVGFTPDGRTLATGGDDGAIRLWNVRSLEEALVLRGHQKMVTGLQFSNDGLLLADCDGEGAVRLWHAPSFGEIALADKEKAGKRAEKLSPRQ
jgi:WD40 repeat protein/serine/threonine protein kinase